MFSAERTLHRSDGAQGPNSLGAELSCVVVGFDAGRRERLAEAASALGWSTVERDGVKAAKIQLLREPPSMMVIDLESVGGLAPEDLKSLAERASKQKSTLLFLCGNEGNVMEEIWARQLGVWLYLPGVVDDSNLSSLFEEGSNIARRRQTGARREAYFPSVGTA